MLVALSLRVTAVASWVSRVAAALAGIVTLGCLALVCGAVVARYFFGLLPSWSDEVGGWLIVILVMLAVGEAQRRGEHVGVDLLLERARGRTRRLLQAFGITCLAATAAILVWQGWEAAAFSRMIGAMPMSIDHLPLWLIQVFVPIGAGLMLLVALAQLLAVAAGLEPLPEEPADDGSPRATE